MFVLIIARQEKFLRMIEAGNFRMYSNIRIIQIYPYVRKVYTQFPHLKKRFERIQE